MNKRDQQDEEEQEYDDEEEAQDAVGSLNNNARVHDPYERQLKKAIEQFIRDAGSCVNMIIQHDYDQNRAYSTPELLEKDSSCILNKQ